MGFQLKLEDQDIQSLYNEAKGYGRVTNDIKEQYEYLKINQIGNAFVSKGQEAPYYYRIQVPKSGNYRVTIEIEAREESIFSIFLERRRCYAKNYRLKKNEKVSMSFTCNVCPIIPDGKVQKYKDEGIDITLIGEKFTVVAIEVSEITCPTLYMIGDSTSADQTAPYPYDPFNSYCGWTQMLPLFLEGQVAISNHARSGRTTESFREEGHWEIVKEQLQPKDWVMIQFGHNDQKRECLDAFGGYTELLKEYIEEVKEASAYPILVTPVSRSLWNGPEFSFNDLLTDYAKACQQIGQEENIPVIDLHQRSKILICGLGPIEAMKYFYPEDWTHFNDFGGEEIARLVIREIHNLNVTLKDALKERQIKTIEIEQLANWERPTLEEFAKKVKKWEMCNEWVKEI